MTGQNRALGPQHPLFVALATTALVAALSYLLPESYAATAVGLAFLLVTYRVALRSDDADAARRFALSLGGLLDPEPIDARRLARDAWGALAWAALAAIVSFPAFWAGYRIWWRPEHAFVPSGPPAVDAVLGQVLGVALPEEAFYRGYLQTAFDERTERRVRVLGAELGPGVVAASALFAVGHLLTVLNPARLAVFFPSLAFGWLRARTRGIGAGLVFHAACNLFAEYLARSYGLGR